VDTIGSSFDTILGVYTGSNVTNLTLVAEDDDSGGNANSRLTFAAAPAVPYQIVVDGYSGDLGNIVLHVRETMSTTPTIHLSAAVQSNQLVLSFNAVAGSAYTIQYADTLTNGWNVLTNLTAASTNVVVQDPIGNSSQRFYRVRTPAN